MSNLDPTTFLDDLQTDIEAVLQNTPGLIDAVVSYSDDADIEQKVARQLAPIKGAATAKPGLAVIVLPPEVSSAESNLPGPPMVVRVEVQCIEHNVINRSPQGTRIPASGAAVRALNALHLRSLGENRFLYAASNDPVSPVRVRPGYTSYAATLELRAPGVAGDGRVLPVTVSESFVPATLQTAFDGTNNDLLFTQADTDPQPITIEILTTGGTSLLGITVSGRTITITLASNFGASYTTAAEIKALIEATPAAAALVSVSYPTGNNGSGAIAQPATASIAYGPQALTGGDDEALALSTATEGASIYYTTDGTYPTPDAATLYTAALDYPTATTTYRVAAYKTGLNPSDVLQFTVTV